MLVHACACLDDEEYSPWEVREGTSARAREPHAHTLMHVINTHTCTHTRTMQIQDASLDEAMNQICVFLNAQLSVHVSNTIAVIGAAPKKRLVTYKHVNAEI